MKKLFLSITAVAIVIFLSLGCVTKQLWKDRTRGEPYQERIISFYTNLDKKEIVFIGDKYHYIFTKNTEDFIPLIKNRKLLKLNDKNINIYATTDRQDSRKVQAHIMIHITKSELNTEQIAWLESHGYSLVHVPPHYGSKYAQPVKEHPEPMVFMYTHEYHLEGTRYIADQKVNTQVIKLKKPIELEVVEFQVINKKSTLYKVAMTPLSVSADAGLIILGVGAVIIYAPFGLTYWGYKQIKGK